MEKEKKLFKNTIILSIGKIFTQCISFFLLPLYTSVLSTTEYGVVDLLNTLIFFLVPIITFQIEQAVFRYLIEKRDDEKNKIEIISSSILFVLIQIIIYLCVLFLLSFFIKNEYTYFLASNVVSYILLSLLQQIARGFGYNIKYSLGTMVSAIFTIVFNLLFLCVFKFGAKGMLLGTFCGQIIGCIYFIFSLKLWEFVKIETIKICVLKRLLKYCIPLIPNQLSWWIFNVSDRVIISLFLSVSQNGIYAASGKFSAIVVLMYNIFDMGWIESVAVNINSKDINHFFNKTFNIILKLFSTICLLMIAVMPFAYPLLIDEKFSFGYYLVPILIISTLFNVESGLVSVVFAAKKNTKDIAKTSILAAVINIIVHFLLLKELGLYAAAISTLVSFVALAAYRTYKIKKLYIDVKIDKKFIINYFFILLGVLIVYYCNENVLLNLITLCVIGGYAVLVNKNSIKSILQIMLNKNRKKGEC